MHLCTTVSLKSRQIACCGPVFQFRYYQLEVRTQAPNRKRMSLPVHTHTHQHTHRPTRETLWQPCKSHAFLAAAHAQYYVEALEPLPPVVVVIYHMRSKLKFSRPLQTSPSLKFQSQAPVLVHDRRERQRPQHATNNTAVIELRLQSRDSLSSRLVRWVPTGRLTVISSLSSADVLAYPQGRSQRRPPVSAAPLANLL